MICYILIIYKSFIEQQYQRPNSWRLPNELDLYYWVADL